MYPSLFVPGEAVASGEIRNEWSGKCVDSLHVDPRKHDRQKDSAIGVYSCHGTGGNQYWLLSKYGDIRKDKFCLDLDIEGKHINFYDCQQVQGNGIWEYDHKRSSVVHRGSGKCLTINPSKTKLLVDICTMKSPRQKWRFEKYDSLKVKRD